MGVFVAPPDSFVDESFRNKPVRIDDIAAINDYRVIGTAALPDFPWIKNPIVVMLRKDGDGISTIHNRREIG